MAYSALIALEGPRSGFTLLAPRAHLEQPASGCSLAPLPGDFYREEAHVFRGATIAAAAARWPLTHMDGSPIGSEDMNVPQGDIGWAQQTIFSRSLFTTSRRLELDDKASCAYSDSGMARPPKLPSDPDFQLEATTLYVARASAIEIWHQLLGFMDQHATVSMTKVSHDKYSLKAEVCGAQTMACCLKVRMYRGHDQDSLAIEFQRRNGDSVLFNSMFRHACAGLRVYAIPARIPKDALTLVSCSSTHSDPPTKPADPAFQLTATTLYMMCDDPKKIWSRLLEVLEAHKTSLRKVCPDKYSLKADIHREVFGMCRLKVHVYREEQEDSFAIEFQRRDGDSVLFNSIYRHACTHLRACVNCDGMQR